MHWSLIVAGLACAICDGRAAHAQTLPCGYVISDVIEAEPMPCVGPSPTKALAISPNGRWVCGQSQSGGISAGEGFWYDTITHELHIFTHPSETRSSCCSDINDHGWLVGFQQTSDDYPYPSSGFVFDVHAKRVVAELLPHPNAAWCDIMGINSSNVVCGMRSIGSPSHQGYPATAFRWTVEGGFEEMSVEKWGSSGAVAIADDGVATIGTSDIIQGRLWNGEEVVSLGQMPDATATFGIDIEAGQHVVGYGGSSLNNLGTRPFEFRNGRFRVLDTLGPEFPVGATNSLNAAGFIVGCVADPAWQHYRACLWIGEKVVDLNSMIPAGSGVTLTRCEGISSEGAIVCIAKTDDGRIVSVVLQPRLRREGDANCDERVNIIDLLLIIEQWGESSAAGDLNNDGSVNIADLLQVIVHWG